MAIPLNVVFIAGLFCIAKFADIMFTVSYKYSELIEFKNKFAKSKQQFLVVFNDLTMNLFQGVLGSLEYLNEMRIGKYKNYIDAAKVSTEALYYSILNVIDCSKSSDIQIPINSESYSVREMMNKIVNIAEVMVRSKGLFIKYFPSQDLPDYIEGDQRKIIQIIINLIQFSIQQTSNGLIYIFTEWHPRKVQPPVGSQEEVASGNIQKSKSEILKNLLSCSHLSRNNESVEEYYPNLEEEKTNPVDNDNFPSEVFLRTNILRKRSLSPKLKKPRIFKKEKIEKFT